MLPYIHIFNKAIPMYGLLITIGLLTGSVYVVLTCKKSSLLWEDAVVIGAMCCVFGFAGAKLLYLFVTFTPSELAKIISVGKSTVLLNGGFVFYGGLLFGILGTWVGARLAHAELSSYANIIIRTLPLVHAFGRIGCLCAGCCYGKPSDMAFGIIFEHPLSDAPTGIPLVPIQLYEAAINLALFFILTAVDEKKFKNGGCVLIYILIYAPARFILEFFRYDVARGIYLFLSLSQWISLVLFVTAIILFFRRQYKQRKTTSAIVR